MAEGKAVNFGYFVRWKRIEKGFRKLTDFAKRVGVASRHMLNFEKHMPTPNMPDETRAAIAGALGMKLEQLDAEWRKTPVPKPSFKETASKEFKSVRVRIRRQVYEQIEAAAKSEGLGASELAAKWLTDAVTATGIAKGLPPGALIDESGAVELTDNDTQSRQNQSGHNGE